MPDISSIGHGSVGPVNRAAGSSLVPSASSRARELIEPRTDSVELSQHARLLDRLRQLPDVREDLVDRVRQEIAAGTYETPEKLEQAIEQLLGDVG